LKKSKDLLLSFKALLLFVEEVNSENVELLNNFFHELREEAEEMGYVGDRIIKAIQSHDFILQKEAILKESIEVIKKQIEILNYIEEDDDKMHEEYLNMWCKTLDNTLTLAKKNHEKFKHLNTKIQHNVEFF
jgi:vacuolar-type H+-ATPase subunit I/STV1